MPGARVGEDQVGRLADLVREAIITSTDRLAEASGTAVLTVLDASGAPRVELTATAQVRGDGDGGQTIAERRLPGEIGHLADDVRRALLANHQRVDGAGQIIVEIRLRGARPSFDISYRGHAA